MTCSPARIAANRANAARSTGPRTPEGKERSRANALKHGMTGAGVVIPEEDREKVAEFAGKLEAEMQPASVMGRFLLKRVAVLAIRLDRCVDQDDAMTARRVREAVRDHEAARYADVEALGARLGDDPAAAVRGLKQTAEGIDYLVRAWLALKGIIARPRLAEWGRHHIDLIENLLGRERTDYPPSPFDGPARAARGDVTGWEEGRGVLSWTQRRALARRRVAEMIDAEVAALRALRPTRSDEDEARDRAEAPRRARFDASREGDRARRYEAAAERGMFRALREFREAETTVRPDSVDGDEAPGRGPGRADRGAPEGRGFGPGSAKDDDPRPAGVAETKPSGPGCPGASGEGGGAGPVEEVGSPSPESAGKTDPTGTAPGIDRLFTEGEPPSGATGRDNPCPTGPTEPDGLARPVAPEGGASRVGGSIAREPAIASVPEVTRTDPDGAGDAPAGPAWAPVVSGQGRGDLSGWRPGERRWW